MKARPPDPGSVPGPTVEGPTMAQLPPDLRRRLVRVLARAVRAEREAARKQDRQRRLE